MQDYLGNDRWHTKRDGWLFPRWDELQVFDSGGNPAAHLDSEYRYEYSIEINGEDRDPPKVQHRPGTQLHDFVERARREYDPPDPPLAQIAGVAGQYSLRPTSELYGSVPTSYRLEGLGWRLDRNRREYTLHADGGEVMRIEREVFMVLLSYRLDIADPRHELLCVCVALAIACIEAEERARD